MFVEDVGRHNAVDAIAGQMWLDRIDGGDKIFYTTGRLTSEMVIKAAQMGIPFLVSRSGLTQMGYEIAEKVGITMIGRATNKHFLLFTGGERFRERRSPCMTPRTPTSPASCSPAARAGAWAASTRAWSSSTGEPMVAHVLERLAPQVDDVLINANQNLDRYARSGYPVVPDAVGGFAGPLAGLHAGLTRATRAFVVTVPCDSPFLPADLVARLAAALDARAERSSPSRRPSTSRIRCSRSCAATCCRISPRSSRAADARSTRGTRRCGWSRSRFDDEADAFRNINTADELAAAAKA